MELVSVIVPVYKVEKYLDECILSIVNQTYKNLEIILVDDGSPDLCPTICDFWACKDSRIKVIHKTNGGLSDARNAALEQSVGNYICFVDSDDILSKYYVEFLYKAVKSYAVQLAACDLLPFMDEEEIQKNDWEADIKVISTEMALKNIIEGIGIRAIACNKLYSKELLFDEKFVFGKYHEDEFFTYRIVGKVQHIAYIDVPLYYYRQHDGSIMSSFSLKRLDSLEAYLQRLVFLKEKYPMLYKQDKVNFCKSCISYYRIALKIKSTDEKQICKKIKLLRKKISFSCEEFLNYSLKDKLYIVASKVPLLYCKVMNWIKRND